ncbi:MAG: hypothetical protein ABJG68_15050 [Crocinitomicaceae bacterium]
MKKRKLLFLGCLIALGLNSCAIYDIHLNKDGSCHVKITEWLADADGVEEPTDEPMTDYFEQFDEHKTDSEVSGYKREIINNKNVVEFDLKHIDSLEHYLTPDPQFNRDSLEQIANFSYTGKELIITKNYEGLSGPGEVTMFMNVGYQAHFTFDQKIKKFNSELDYVKQPTKKKISVHSNSETISYGEGSFKTIIKLK